MIFPLSLLGENNTPLFCVMRPNHEYLSTSLYRRELYNTGLIVNNFWNCKLETSWSFSSLIQEWFWSCTLSVPSMERLLHNCGTQRQSSYFVFCPKQSVQPWKHQGRPRWLWVAQMAAPAVVAQLLMVSLPCREGCGLYCSSVVFRLNWDMQGKPPTGLNCCSALCRVVHLAVTIWHGLHMLDTNLSVQLKAK